ncbi:hypothetical protein KFL_000360375 [Klebsormidium nitens]|uniref:Uncharacterized protein n=1 Tax=Klebsormidium nitens TaxID=105231 RepID=A0A1Y1HNW7_KLENI|nr:hypothetical protein KFL_000360375 [Klebsormidium nitens]|eukprot:GAQ79723.1 hypothetical protein KFL_000360375 [Klebsormidium nitens]
MNLPFLLRPVVRHGNSQRSVLFESLPLCGEGLLGLVQEIAACSSVHTRASNDLLTGSRRNGIIGAAFLQSRDYSQTGIKLVGNEGFPRPFWSSQACKLTKGGTVQPLVGFAAEALHKAPDHQLPFSTRQRSGVSHEKGGQLEGPDLRFQRHMSSGVQPLILSKEPVVYIGSMSGTLKKVKLLSISSCVLSCLGAPVITFWTAPTLPIAVKTVVSMSMVLFGAGTTALLHWFSNPYVHKVIWRQGSEEMEVHTLTWLATTSKQVIRLKDVRPANTQRPLATFAVNGRFYYVDGANFVTSAGRELREKLLPHGYQD